MYLKCFGGAKRNSVYKEFETHVRVSKLNGRLQKSGEIPYVYAYVGPDTIL